MEELKAQVVAFRDERDWKQFHNPKDISISISLEASELLAEFLWKNPEEADKAKVQDELADVFIAALLLADHYGFNVDQIVREKLRKTALKYPVEKARGRREKYTELADIAEEEPRSVPHSGYSDPNA